ncbi:MAG: hypothetical protein H6607_03435 [Flavobacteriales bacterium]|nr:hypothetical protein [Flavobacteriales bacterium]
MTFKNEEKDKRSRLYLLLVVLALLAVNGLLVYQLLSKKKVVEEKQEQVDDLTAEKAQLNEELDRLNLELVEYKGENQKLDSVIREQEMKLNAKVAELKKAINSGNVSKADIEKFKKQIQELTTERDGYIAQIEQLKKEKEFFRDSLYAKKNELVEQTKKTEAVVAERDKINAQLDIAKRLKTKSLRAYGIKVKGSGTEKETDRFSKTDRIMVEAVIDNNAVAIKESKTLYLQILSPEKTTLNNQAKGSGTFTLDDHGSLYTKKEKFNFTNSNEKVVFFWEKSNDMTAGEYTANVYCEGVLLGSTKFTLK